MDTPPPNRELQPAQPSRYYPIAVAILVILVAHLIGRVGAYCSPIHADSYVYTTVGYRIANGEVFYRDVSDVKPPGLYLLYAIAYLVSPPGRAAVIPIDTLFGFLGYWAVYRLARDIYGRRIGALLAVTTAAVTNYFIMMDFVTDGFGLPETYMLLPAAMAVRSYRRGWSSASLAPWIATGLWLGAALMIKQTALPLLATLALHGTITTVVERRGFETWFRSGASIAIGLAIAVSPFVTMVWVQGTANRAWTLLGPAAARMLSRETAWPSQWTDITPIWIPLVWCACGLTWWMESRLRRRSQNNHPTARDVGLLSLWFVAECTMLVFLPLRAYHYYVLSALPCLLLSGLFWNTLTGLELRYAKSVVFTAISGAAVSSAVCARSILSTTAPISLNRYQHHDADADRAIFEQILALKINTYGAPPPEDP